MTFVAEVLVAGITGTALMTASMHFIHKSGWANADMTRALGSLITRRYEHSFLPGLGMHLGAGILFAIPYLVVIRSAGFVPLSANLAVGAALGALHGAAMAFVLMASVAERHPVERFRTAGPDVGAAHLAGHIAYGLGVGLIAWIGARGM